MLDAGHTVGDVEFLLTWDFVKTPGIQDSFFKGTNFLPLVLGIRFGFHPGSWMFFQRRKASHLFESLEFFVKLIF